MRWRPPRNKATQKKASPVLSILFGRVGPRVARGTAAGPERGRRGPGGSFPWPAAAAQRRAVPCFVSRPPSIPPAAPGGADRAPLDGEREERKVAFTRPAWFSPAPAGRPAPGPAAPPAAAHPAHPAHPPRPAPPGCAGVCGRDKRALSEGGWGGGGEEGVKQPGGSNSICVAWKSEGVFPHFALIRLFLGDGFSAPSQTRGGRPPRQLAYSGNNQITHLLQLFRQSRSRVERTTGAGERANPPPTPLPRQNRPPRAARSRARRGQRGTRGGRRRGPGGGCRGGHGRCRAAPQPRRRPRFPGRGREAARCRGRERNAAQKVPPEETHSEIFFSSSSFLNALCCLRGGEAAPCPKRVFIFMRARVNKDKSPL